MPDPAVRIPCVRRCVVFRGARRSDAILCGLGVDGAYLTFVSSRGSVIPEEGESVTLSFCLPGDTVTIETEARVTERHAETRDTLGGPPRGCGVSFASLPVEAASRIRALIEDYETAAHPRIAVPAPHSGFIRVPFVEPCLLVGEQETWEAVVCNVSLLGAYVAVHSGPAVGETVRLCVKMPGLSDPLDVPCQVIWLRADDTSGCDGLPSGCGLKFLEHTAGPEIQRLIRQHEARPRQ